MDSSVEPASAPLPDTALDQLFRNARTHNEFKLEPISDEDLRAIYDLVKWGPTTANSQPLRIVFLKSKAAKERLRPALSASETRRSSSWFITWRAMARSASFWVGDSSRGRLSSTHTAPSA